jgi:hypothetical protein
MVLMAFIYASDQWDDYTRRNRKLDLIQTKLLHILLLLDLSKPLLLYNCHQNHVHKHTEDSFVYYIAST